MNQPDEQYRADYYRAAAELRKIAARLQERLHPCDVWGLYIGIGLDVMQAQEPQQIQVQWLRGLADAIESGEAGPSRWGTA